MRKSITVTYRAVHRNSPWRKVRGHTSIENALYGRDNGAPGLFHHRARIDYEKHGEPLYAVIWEDHATFGFVVKKDSSSSDGTMRVRVPINVVLGYNKRGGTSVAELEAHYLQPTPESPTEAAAGEDAPPGALPLIQAEEGAASLGEHLLHERSPALVAAKKADVLRRTGRLACEACGFDFAITYGELGHGFCEVHHSKPLGWRRGSETTLLEDLAVLCSNCHSIIHRTDPMWNIATLAAHVAQG